MLGIKKFGVTMRKAIVLICCLLFSSCLAVNDWRSLWHHGVDYLYQGEYQEASLELDQAIAIMSKEDLTLYPYVLVARTASSYVLNDYSRVLKDTELALESQNLTNYERLVCGMRRIAVFMKLGDEAAAIEELNI
jgi:tetratricopeptide (TPR) repeat protein